MAYSNRECDVITKYRLLTQSGGLSNRDIRTLTGCVSSTASRILYAVQKRIAATGVVPNHRVVSAKSFLDYMDWSFEEIQRLAFEEMRACRQIDKMALI